MNESFRQIELPVLDYKTMVSVIKWLESHLDREIDYFWNNTVGLHLRIECTDDIAVELILKWG